MDELKSIQQRERKGHVKTRVRPAQRVAVTGVFLRLDDYAIETPDDVMTVRAINFRAQNIGNVLANIALSRYKRRATGISSSHGSTSERLSRSRSTIEHWDVEVRMHWSLAKIDQSPIAANAGNEWKVQRVTTQLESNVSRKQKRRKDEVTSGLAVLMGQSSSNSNGATTVRDEMHTSPRIRRTCDDADLSTLQVLVENSLLQSAHGEMIRAELWNVRSSRRLFRGKNYDKFLLIQQGLWDSSQRQNSLESQRNCRVDQMLSDTEIFNPSENYFAKFEQKNLRKCLRDRRIRDSDDLLRRARIVKAFREIREESRKNEYRRWWKKKDKCCVRCDINHAARKNGEKCVKS